MKNDIFSKLKLQQYSVGLIFINVFLIFVFAAAGIPKSKKEIITDSLISANEAEHIGEILISIPNSDLQAGFNTVRLVRKEDGFVLNAAGREYAAKPDIMKRFIAQLSAKQDFISVTTDVRQFPFLGLDDAHAGEITVLRKDGSRIGEFVFGKQNTLGTGRYIRIDGRTRVFLMPDILSAFLTLRPDFWIDLQIYGGVFSGSAIQAFEQNNLYILRSEKNEKAFSELELFFKQFSAVDIFAALPVTSPQTDSFTAILDNKERLKINFTPLENGDFVLSDSVSENAYIVSGYTKRRVDEAVAAIRTGGL